MCLMTAVVCAKQIRQSSTSQRVPAKPVPQQKESVYPDINTLPAPLNQTPDAYARSKVAVASQQLINDIFPKEGTIERVLFEFKEQYPGPNKDADIALLTDAIFYDPEIRKHINTKNATSLYNFIKEALSKAWEKKNDLVWAS